MQLNSLRLMHYPTYPVWYLSVKSSACGSPALLTCLFHLLYQLLILIQQVGIKRGPTAFDPVSQNNTKAYNRVDPKRKE